LRLAFAGEWRPVFAFFLALNNIRVNLVFPVIFGYLKTGTPTQGTGLEGVPVETRERRRNLSAYQSPLRLGPHSDPTPHRATLQFVVERSLKAPLEPFQVNSPTTHNVQPAAIKFDSGAETTGIALVCRKAIQEHFFATGLDVQGSFLGNQGVRRFLEWHPPKYLPSGYG
jgi:hypothetical protein